MVPITNPPIQKVVLIHLKPVSSVKQQGEACSGSAASMLVLLISGGPFPQIINNSLQSGCKAHTNH